MVVPSGEKANEATNSRCPLSVARLCPVAGSQSVIWPSCCPTAIVAPSGANATVDAPIVPALLIVDLRPMATLKLCRATGRRSGYLSPGTRCSG